MIQNPNEIAARQRMEEAISRIEANVRTRLQMNRRQFVCGSAATMALAMLGLAGCSPTADANGGVGSISSRTSISSRKTSTSTPSRALRCRPWPSPRPWPSASTRRAAT